MVSDIICIDPILFFLNLMENVKNNHYLLLHTESCKISNLEFYFLGQIRFKTESISNAFAAPVCTYSRKINNLQGGRIEEGDITNLQEQQYGFCLGVHFCVPTFIYFKLFVFYILFSSILLKCLKENSI